ncbi:MAG: nickel-type superoxide dismutase maturation protease [Acidobacteriota bacterium]|nr:nickel-type superoxide dismutase maturation protease [Acidobacteriota bacterium]
MKNELPEADWWEQVAYLCGFREIFLVQGDSMLPSLKDGDLVLVNPYAEPKTGDIVLAQHPFQKSVRIIKRIREISPEGRYFLVGDNAGESTDSRSFGALSAKDILGKAEAIMK